MYLAPVGHTAQVSQRWHTLRPCHGSVLRAHGWVQKGMPAASVHSRMRRRFQESGRGGIGYGLDRGSYSGGPCSPATPMRSSASW